VVLELTREDLGAPGEGGRAGVTVWWPNLKQAKGNRTQCVKWPDLVLVTARVEFPRDLGLHNRDGWGEEPHHVAVIPECATPLVRTPVPVPDLQAYVDLRRRKFQRVKQGQRVLRWTKRVRFKELCLADCELKRDLWIAKRSLRRIERSLDARVGVLRGDLDARVVDFGDVPVLVVWKKDRVRAAATLTTRRVLERAP